MHSLIFFQILLYESDLNLRYFSESSHNLLHNNPNLVLMVLLLLDVDLQHHYEVLHEEGSTPLGKKACRRSNPTKKEDG